MSGSASSPASSLRAWAYDIYYRLWPTQAGKNRGLAYRLLKKGQ